MDGLNGAGVSVPGTRERGSDCCPRDLVLYAESNLPGLKGAVGVCLLAHRSANVHRDTARYGARHELAFWERGSCSCNMGRNAQSMVSRSPVNRSIGV